jgi:hypothetical protein
MDDKGDVIYQAKLDGFDYRTHLTCAINKDEESLALLLDYTANGQLMGVGADEHCEVLLNLLKHWGDSEFATILANRSLNVRNHVKEALKYENPHWSQDQFPKTYKLLHSHKNGLSFRPQFEIQPQIPNNTLQLTSLHAAAWRHVRCVPSDRS